jgi:hypothetical protein
MSLVRCKPCWPHEVLGQWLLNAAEQLGDRNDRRLCPSVGSTPHPGTPEFGAPGTDFGLSPALHNGVPLQGLQYLLYEDPLGLRYLLSRTCYKQDLRRGRAQLVDFKPTEFLVGGGKATPHSYLPHVAEDGNFYAPQCWWGCGR